MDEGSLSIDQLAAKAISMSPEQIAALTDDEREHMRAALVMAHSVKELPDGPTGKGTRVCKICKKRFVKDPSHVKYCSAECKRIAIYSSPRQKLKVHCHVCNRLFETVQPNQKYCSNTCKELDRKTKRKCARCGKEFEARQAKYCSTACRLGAIAAKAGSKQYHELLCLNCGQTMVVRNSSRKFCSPLCHTEYREKQKVISLEQRIKFPASKYVGNYVYAWMDNGAVFYIGKGVARRVVANHGDSSCQAWRDKIGQRFSYAIIEDHLTEEGAILVESVLIKLIQPPCNLIGGTHRAERPPLTLPRTFSRLEAEADPPMEGVPALGGGGSA